MTASPACADKRLSAGRLQELPAGSGRRNFGALVFTAVVAAGALAACGGGGSGQPLTAAPLEASQAVVVTTAPALGRWSHRFLVDRDGGVVAVAFSRRPAGVALARYVPSGEPDASFAGGVTRDLGAGMLDALAATIDPRSGAIYVVACPPPDCHDALLVRRFDRDGTLDERFASRVQPIRRDGSMLSPSAVAVDADGRIVVVADAVAANTGSLLIARLLPDGSVDRAFGDAGVAVDRVGPAGAVAVDAQGRIVVAGSGFVSRYEADGSADAGFGRRGVAAIPGLLLARDVVVTSDGSVVVGGSGGERRSPGLAIVRLTADGRPDKAFGANGVLLERRAGDHWARVDDLLLLEDDGLLAAGWATRGDAVMTRRYRLVVLSVDRDGLDQTFAERGRLTVESLEARGYALLHQADGLVAVGPDDDLAPRQLVFARFDGPVPPGAAP